MKFVLLIGCVLQLGACAQTPEQAAAYRQFGMQMLAAQQQANNQAMAYQAPSYTCQNIGNSVQCMPF